MLEVGSSEARNRFAALLTAVESGGDVTITRRGRPVARLVRADADTDRQRGANAARRVMALRKGLTLGTGTTLRALIDDGRR